MIVVCTFLEFINNMMLQVYISRLQWLDALLHLSVIIRYNYLVRAEI